jgi:GT2 family glycosyltransferase
MTKEVLPKISIVTLNWNQTEVTCQFLESTRALIYPNYEILVCDMGSSVDPTSRIQSGQYPYVRVLRSETNLGFTGGNNWGMRQADGDYVFIVNNDTELTPDLLNKLLEPFFADKKIGVTSPKIRFYHNKDIIQYAGFTAINVFTGRNGAVGSLEYDKGQHDVSGTTHAAHGCAMLVSREVIQNVGMFPEKFFIYYEELDWSARILRAGYKIWYVGDALIYHKESITMGKKSAIKVYYHTRNRILYMRRNTNVLQFSVFLLFFVFVAAPKSIIQFLYHKQYDHLKSFLKGVYWNLTTSSYSPV